MGQRASRSKHPRTLAELQPTRERHTRLDLVGSADVRSSTRAPTQHLPSRRRRCGVSPGLRPLKLARAIDTCHVVPWHVTIHSILPKTCSTPFRLDRARIDTQRPNGALLQRGWGRCRSSQTESSSRCRPYLVLEKRKRTKRLHAAQEPPRKTFKRHVATPVGHREPRGI